MSSVVIGADDGKPSVLLWDDDRALTRALAALLRQHGYAVADARGADDVRERRPHVLLFEPATPGLDADALLRGLRRDRTRTVPVALSGAAHVARAVTTMRAGAADFVLKPARDADVLAAVARAARHATLQDEAEPRDEIDVSSRDPAMLRTLALAQTVAPASTTVLVVGETGTGKSRLARALHRASGRRGGPFVEVACGSLAESLLESELFGHAAGAYTDAGPAREGKFAAADGGTIFLDEVNSASPALQVKLLRVLQERQFEPVGSNRTRSVDVRVVLATNQPLEPLVEAGAFRRDLYYRANVVALHLPPLRERRGDVAGLAAHFLGRAAREANRPLLRFAPDALATLAAHDWPGNVRELENACARAALLARGPTVTADDLPDAVRRSARPALRLLYDAPETLEAQLLAAERAAIDRALARHNGQRTPAARDLGIDRTTLFKKLRKLDGVPASRAG